MMMISVNVVVVADVFSFVVGDVESYYQQQQSAPLVVVVMVVVEMILEVYDVHVQIPFIFRYQLHFLADQLFCELLLVRRMKHYELHQRVVPYL